MINFHFFTRKRDVAEKNVNRPFLFQIELEFESSYLLFEKLVE